MKDLILVKKKLDFTKEEFIQEYFFDESIFPCKKLEDYDNIYDFKLTFFEDSYDAVINRNDFTVIFYLEERIDDFHLMLDKKYGVNNVVSYK